MRRCFVVSGSGWSSGGVISARRKMAESEGSLPIAYYCALMTRSFAVKSAGSGSRRAAAEKKQNKVNMIPSHVDLFDVDANLTSPALLKDGDATHHLKLAASVGVSRMVVPGSTLDESEQAARLVADLSGTAAAQSTLLFATAGCHPYHASEELSAWGGCEQAVKNELKRLLLGEKKNAFVAVGECGLDYSPSFPCKEDQMRIFEAQVELACELKLPLFLHERLAHEDFMAALDRIRNRSSLPPLLVHCFSGGRRELEKYLSIGSYVSISGLACKRDRGKSLRELLPLIPLDKIMVETDAPYLGFPGCRTICPKRKKSQSPNVPSALPFVVDTVAEAMGVDAQILAKAATANARRFFGV